MRFKKIILILISVVTFLMIIAVNSYLFYSVFKLDNVINNWFISFNPVYVHLLILFIFSVLMNGAIALFLFDRQRKGWMIGTVIGNILAVIVIAIGAIWLYLSLNGMLSIQSLVEVTI